MFRKYVVCGICLWVLGVIAILYSFYVAFPNGQIEYQRLLNTNVSNQKKQDLDCRYMKHLVTKQILYSREGNRLQSRLISNHSQLVFNRQNQRDTFIEYFEPMTFTMQEHFLYEHHSHMPTQMIRRGSAEKAFYSYKTNKLEAYNVHLSRYIVDGHNWPTILPTFSPYIQGTAHKILFSFANNPNLTAQGIQGSFHEISSKLNNFDSIRNN